MSLYSSDEARVHDDIHGNEIKISSFPNPFQGNPYLNLLYSSLESEGVGYFPSGYFGQEWLRGNKNNATFIHFHWVGKFYENANGENSIPRLAMFLGKIWFARMLGYKVIWTAHNLYPHNRSRNLKAWIFRFLFVHSVNIVFVNFNRAKDEVARLFLLRSNVHVIPHGNYRPVYPVIPKQMDAKKALGLINSQFVFLLFGAIDPYKGPHSAIQSFSGFQRNDVRLIIKGQCLVPDYAEHLKALAGVDNRIELQIGRDDVSDAEVCQWMSAIDCVVAPYKDIFTSGVLYLAATFGKPIIAPRLGCFIEFEEEEFVFLYDPARIEIELFQCMERVLSADRDAVSEAAIKFADNHAWPDIAKKAARVLHDY